MSESNDITTSTREELLETTEHLNSIIHEQLGRLDKKYNEVEALESALRQEQETSAALRKELEQRKNLLWMHRNDVEFRAFVDRMCEEAIDSWRTRH